MSHIPPSETIESLSARIQNLHININKLAETITVLNTTKKPTAEPRTKKKAGANEAIDINTIIEGINTKNTCGLKIMLVFTEKFPGKEIVGARERKGGSRGTHYDFEICVRTIGSEDDGEWKRIEHKGSHQYRPIKESDEPWKAGVQFHNGGSEKYSLARKYARTWHAMYIESNKFKNEFGISAAIPTFDDWFKSDCKAQDKPKTAFGKELKEKVIAKRGTSLLSERMPLNDSLIITEDDKKTLIAEVIPIANHALEQKDYWLTIHGNLAGEFYIAWYPKFTIESIHEVIITKKKDIEMEFRCGGDFVFHGILRWGYGAGFSNLRLDLK